MHYLKKEEIIRLNIDINSACNAACPGCARQLGGIYPNKHFTPNRHMPLDTWKKLFSEIGHQIHSVVFCGNYGDAGATNYLPEMLEFAHTVNDKTYFIVVSNMGLNSEDYWKRLGSCIPKANLQIQCSIDGLADTNHIYRRFVRWEKVMANVKALASTDALMIWKFIEFEWNKHQIETAKELAKSLNFHDFIVTNNNQPDTDKQLYNFYLNSNGKWNDVITYKVDPPFTIPDHNELNPIESLALENKNVRPFDNIECYTKTEQSIHIDWNGNVWPCCWFGGAAYNPNPQVIAMQKLYVPDISSNWNNVNYHTIDEIMNHEFYTNNLMQGIKTNPSAVCSSSCGKCGNKFNIVNTIGKQS